MLYIPSCNNLRLKTSKRRSRVEQIGHIDTHFWVETFEPIFDSSNQIHSYMIVFITQIFDLFLLVVIFLICLSSSVDQNRGLVCC